MKPYEIPNIQGFTILHDFFPNKMKSLQQRSKKIEEDWVEAGKTSIVKSMEKHS